MTVWRPPARFDSFVVPPDLLEETLVYLDDGAECEQIAYWAGTAEGPNARISRVVKPFAVRGERFVYVPVEEVSRVVNECSEHEDFLVCQLHTHPAMEDHSETDECGTVSKREGFVSLVVPYYGKLSTVAKPLWFGYELQGGQWLDFDVRRIHVHP